MEKKKKIKLIYLVGNSHSGSTILSFYIGSFKQICFCGEFKKLNFNKYKKTCSCGKKAIECSFWKDLVQSYPEYFEQSIAAANGWEAFKAIQKNKNKSFAPKKINLEVSFLKGLSKEAVKWEPENKYLMDSSKSLWRLQFLEKIEEIDLKVIHLKRNFKSNLSSFVKRKRNFWKSILSLKLNTYLIDKHLKNSNVPSLEIHYESFIENPKKELKTISEFLDIPFDFNPQQVENRSFHTISGNYRTRMAFLDGERTLKQNTNKENPFTTFQKMTLRLFGIK